MGCLNSKYPYRCTSFFAGKKLLSHLDQNPPRSGFGPALELPSEGGGDPIRIAVFSSVQIFLAPLAFNESINGIPLPTVGNSSSF